MSTFNEKDDHNTTGNISDSEEHLSHDNDRFRTETDTQDFQEEALDLEEEEEGGKKSKGNTVKIIAGVGVAAVLVVGGVIAFSGGSNEPNDNVQPTAQNSETENKSEELKNDVVKTQEGIDNSTSDPDLQSALNVKKQPEVKHELPFKDVQPENNDLTPPAPIGQVDPIAPVNQGSLTPPAPVGQVEVAKPIEQVDQGSLTPPAPVGQVEVPKPIEQVDQGSLTPPAPVGQVEAPKPIEQIDHGSLTPPVPVGQVEVNKPITPEQGNLTPSTVDKEEVKQTENVTIENQLTDIDKNKDTNGGLLGGNNHNGMIDPSENVNVSTSESDINGSMNKILAQMNSLSENVKSLNDKVSKIDETIIVKKADFDKLVERVAALEKLHTNKDGKIVACTCDTNKNSEKANVTTKKAPVKKQAYKPRDSITVVKKSGDLTNNRNRGYSAPKEVRRTGASMKLESVVGDRAWVRTSNGSIRSYSVGDILPNGKVIGNVDSQNGVFDKSGVKVLSR